MPKPPTSRGRRLGAVHPNAGIEADYKRRMERQIEAMHRSLIYWIAVAYRRDPPVMAMDAPADELRRAMRRLGQRWTKDFDAMSEDLAKWFAQSATKRSDAALAEILRKGGMTVKFKMTPAATDIMKATIAEQVNLIRSIPQEHLKRVEGMVMRSVQQGRSLGSLTKDLEKAFDITHSRAAFIARDQNNKATAAITRARQEELGIYKAIWLHSGGGRHPRPTHVANSGKTYDVRKGWYDPAVGQWIWPGTEPNCRCVSQPVIFEE